MPPTGESFPSPQAVVSAIHASDLRLGLAITGGGSQAIADLLVVPGGSRTLVEAIVPYAPESLAAWLGSRPEHFCAARTARAMAMTAYRRMRTLRENLGESATAAEHLVGLGCTASLASDRPKRGAHRVHIALQSTRCTQTYSLELQKNARSRAAEEQLVAALILNAIAGEAGLAERLAVELFPSEQIDVVRTEAPPLWQDLVTGNRTLVVRHASAASPPAEVQPEPGLVVFPGAFHPLHEGHRHMAAVAQEWLGKSVEFEISVENVDKPRLDYTEMAARLAQFSDRTVWFSRAATFFAKALSFPGATFVVGVDTVERINDPRYYHKSEANRDDAIRWIAACGCRFLVFGRCDPRRGFVTLGDLNLSPSLVELCQAVPESSFRKDVSSTELRRAPHTEN
ncbi:MAG: hypothetical protein KF708_15400 [Pirellulales bacterium]|nr:hypothetical protein [Pirellulales bacterium]